MDLPKSQFEKDDYSFEPLGSPELKGRINVFRTHGSSLVVFFILILLSGTFFGWFYMQKTINYLAYIKFEKEIKETELLIKERLDQYSQLSYGVKALFASSRTVERNEWAVYLTTVNLLEKYPGIRAMRYIERVSHAQKEAFIQSVRTDTSLSPTGYPDFKIYPEGEREEYYVVKYAEPIAGQERLLGFDIRMEKERFAVTQEARDLGTAAVTPIILLMTEVEGEKGFLISLPIYRNDAPVSTVEERREALVGFVNTLFRSEDLLSGIFGRKSVHPEVGFKVYDGEVLTSDHLVYDDEHVLQAVYPGFRPRFSSDRQLKVANRVWTLRFTALPDFGLSETEEKLPTIVVVGGLIFSTLLFGILYSFVTARAQAVSIAEGMTSKLQESQRQYADLVEGAPDPIITLDRLGRLKSMNPAAERVSGYLASELLGKYFGAMNVLTIPSLSRSLQEFALVIVGKERPPFEMELIRKDGVLLIMEANPRPIKQAGKTLAIQVIFRDVTERKRTEKTLKEFSTYLDKIINSVADPIFVKDRKHHWVLLNEAYCHFIGRKREEIVGRTDYDFFPKEEAEIFLEMDEFVFETGKENLNEEKFTDAHGITHIVLTKKNLYTDTKGEKFIVGIVRDITEQKRSEEKINQLNEDLERRNSELSSMNQELEAFSYSVSHDLRAPLRAINGFANALLEDCLPTLPEEGQRYLHLITQNAKNMGQLIDDLLAFSRFSRRAMDYTVVDIGQLAREVSRELKQLFPERHIEFKIHPLFEIKGDLALLRQVVTNLLSNAVKFTQQRKEANIEVESRREANEVIYSVRDNGVGFDKQYVGKLFGVFQRLHSSEEFEGTGVGLAIVQRIVHRHGGRVWAEGEVGKGATFFFSLPTVSYKEGK